ncbi:hypothetical protein APHAL10511_002994 [Amanita phalloides]|nr:hypothetical protein APHAL10511_002994 [Amanita phalloides]
MPQENRKRGKKHKKHPQETVRDDLVDGSSGPSWIRPVGSGLHDANPEAPYGYVDNDVKAYFRTVDIQLRDWQEIQEPDADGDKDPNQDRHLFFVAALSEMTGKEKQLATDPDCSIILERMAHSMDDFVRRVFVDSLAGSFASLATHRFASHVCQTFFTVARDTVSREIRGVMPEVPITSEHGELRTMTQLILDICEELLPSIGYLIMDPYASHVIRSLLVLLTPALSTNEPSPTSSLRSKKSQRWKAKQGAMTSVFANEKGKREESSVPAVPSSFGKAARRFVESLRRELSDNEVRALAASKAASPALKVLVEIEANHNLSTQPESLMDNVLAGAISSCLNDKSLTHVEPSDFVVTLLRDAASSRLFEAIIVWCPDHVFTVLWRTYFSVDFPKLAVHPVANFVVSRAIERISIAQFKEACDQFASCWNKLLQANRIMVFKAFVERAAKLGSCEDIVIEAIFSAFQLESEEEKVQLVPCLLHLTTYKDYTSRKSEKDAIPSRYHDSPNTNPAEPTNHGSQLLQALLRLSAPHNEIVIDSLVSLSVEERIKLAHNMYSSRIFDVLLTSPSVASKSRRRVVMEFIGKYHLLADDRIGSHVADHCWEHADTYLKEKIARSLIPHDRDLAASYYGRFFARNLDLQLLQRRPDEWKNKQVERKRQKEAEQQKEENREPVQDKSQGVERETTKKKRKRESRVREDEEEIDSAFSDVSKKTKKESALHGEGRRKGTQATVDVPRGTGPQERHGESPKKRKLSKR